MQVKWITALSLSSVLALACGSSGPDTNKVRADFDSPSGKTSDKDAVIAANSKRSASGNATGAAGALTPFGGLGLASDRISEGPFSRVSALATRDFIVSSLRRRGPISARFQAQTEEGEFDFSDCYDPSSASASGGGTSVSYSYSVDFSNCNSGMTGSMDVDGSFEFEDETYQVGTGVFEMTYNNVCTTSSGDCLNGVIAMEFSQGGTDGLSNFVLAWDIVSTVGGNTIATRGGMRYADGGGSSSFEYLAYVRDSSGVEVSYVFSLSSDAEGNSVVRISGADGSVECVFNADGSGNCTGDATFDWEAGYEDSIESNPLFADYED